MAKKTRYELFEQGLIRKYKDVEEIPTNERIPGQGTTNVVLRESGWSPHNIRDLYLFGSCAVVSYYVNPEGFKGDNYIDYAGAPIEGEDKRPMLNVLHKLPNSISALVSNLQTLIIFVDKTKGTVARLEDGNPDAFYVATPDGRYTCAPRMVWQCIGGDAYAKMLSESSACNNVKVLFVDISRGNIKPRAEKGATVDETSIVARVKNAKYAAAKYLNEQVLKPLGKSALNMRIGEGERSWTVVRDAVVGHTETFKLGEEANDKIRKILPASKAFLFDEELRMSISQTRMLMSKASLKCEDTVDTANVQVKRLLENCIPSWTQNTAVYPIDEKLAETIKNEIRKPFDALCYALTQADVRFESGEDNATVEPVNATREDNLKLLQTFFGLLAQVQRSATTEKAVKRYTEGIIFDTCVKTARVACAQYCKPEIAQALAALREAGDPRFDNLIQTLGSNDARTKVDGIRALFGYFCKFYLQTRSIDFTFAAGSIARFDKLVGSITVVQQNVLENCTADLLFTLYAPVVFYVALIEFVRFDVLKLDGTLPTMWLTMRNKVCKQCLQRGVDAGKFGRSDAVFRVTPRMQDALNIMLCTIAEEQQENTADFERLIADVMTTSDVFTVAAGGTLTMQEFMCNVRIAIDLMKLSLESEKK